MKIFPTWTWGRNGKKNRTSRIYNNIQKYLIFISLVFQKSSLLTKTHNTYQKQNCCCWHNLLKFPKYGEIYKPTKLRNTHTPYQIIHIYNNKAFKCIVLKEEKLKEYILLAELIIDMFLLRGEMIVEGIRKGNINDKHS